MTTPSLPTHAQRHPAVRHLERLLDVVAGLPLPEGVAAVVGITPGKLFVVAMDYDESLTDVQAFATSAHHTLLMAKLAPRIRAHAWAWHKATQKVPGLADLCGTGTLVVERVQDGLRAAWEPVVRTQDRGHIDTPPLPHMDADTIVQAVAQAVTAAPATVFDIHPLRLFFAGDTSISSAPSYGQVHSTRAMVEALGAVLTNDGPDAVGRHLLIGGKQSVIHRKEAFHKALNALPDAKPDVRKATDLALAAWRAHLGTPAPTALGRITFTANPRAATEVVHLNDDDRTEPDAVPLPPFTEADNAWIAHACALWGAVVDALPANGFWTCFGITALAICTPDTTSVHVMGRGMKGWQTDDIPTTWLHPVQGKPHIVQVSEKSSAYTVKARTAREAAAVVWRALQGDRDIRGLSLKVWQDAYA